MCHQGLLVCSWNQICFVSFLAYFSELFSLDVAYLDPPSQPLANFPPKCNLLNLCVAFQFSKFPLLSFQSKLLIISSCSVLIDDFQVKLQYKKLFIFMCWISVCNKIRKKKIAKKCIAGIRTLATQLTTPHTYQLPQGLFSLIHCTQSLLTFILPFCCNKLFQLIQQLIRTNSPLLLFFLGFCYYIVLV